MMMFALLLSVAAQDLQEQSIDVADWSVPNVAFTCGVDGLPTMGVWYEPGYKVVDFNEVRSGTGFVLKEPVKSVRYSVANGVSRWVIEASGNAVQARGINEGDYVSIKMIITRSEAGDMSAGWELQAGSYGSHLDGCRQIPSRPRMLKAQ